MSEPNEQILKNFKIRPKSDPEKYLCEGLKSCVKGDRNAAEINLKKALALGHPLAKEILKELDSIKN